MHTLTLRLTCKPGVRESYAKTLPETLVATRAFDGCKSVEIYLDQDNVMSSSCGKSGSRELIQRSTLHGESRLVSFKS